MSSTEAGLVGRPPNKEKQAPPKSYGLDPMFAPASVAVIGATSRPGTVGHSVLENLLHSKHQAKVYAVNAKHPEVLGIKTYASIRDIPGPVDLAIVATPAATVPQIVGECVDAGAKSAVVLSAGFRERGADGAALERQIQEQLRRGTMRLIGPNCLGIMNPLIGLNATLPKILTQISWRRRAVTGALNPDLINASPIARIRSDLLPSGSPSVMRFPSVWRITPGSTISVAR